MTQSGQSIRTILYTNQYLWYFRLASLILMILIFVVSHQSKIPGPPQPSWDFALKKFGHMVVYGLLFILLLKSQTKADNLSVVIVFGLLVAYAVSDELHQLFVPGRFGSLLDIGYDSLGASGAYLTWMSWKGD